MIKDISAWIRPKGVPANWTEKYYNLYKAAYLESESAQKVSDYYINKGATDPNPWHIKDNAIRLHKNAALLHKNALKLAPGPKEKKFHEQRMRYHDNMAAAHPEPVTKDRS